MSLPSCDIYDDTIEKSELCLWSFSENFLRKLVYLLTAVSVDTFYTSLPL